MHNCENKNHAKKVILTITITFCKILAVRAEKYGLIIAVGNYPAAGGWQAISSKNDIIHVNEALIAIGFLPKNISIIVDEQATRDGIVASIKALTDKLTQGDIIYIHFSGHGQQVLDDSGDEIDQLDEAIVPYDSPMKFKKGVYEGERLLRDDTIGELTNKIRTKCGIKGQLILVLDSCHSGTGVRGMGKARGTATIMAPESFTQVNTAETSMTIAKTKEKNLAPMACFYGASARELNYETMDNQARPVGSLTYALTSVLANLKTESTFGEIFAKVKLKMKVLAPRQNPQWEGPDNIQVFGGQINSVKDYYKIASINKNTIKAEVGTLSDVFAGSIVELYSNDKKKAICRGEVTTAMLSNSVITTDVPVEMGENELLTIKVISKAYPALKVSIASKLSAKSVWSKTVQELLSMPLVAPVESSAELFFAECKDDHCLQLATGDGTILAEKIYDEANLVAMKKDMELAIRSYAQGNFLRSYESQNTPYDFSVELIPVDCATGIVLPQNSSVDLQVKEGSCVKFKITNNGISGAYISLIDIQPDNGLNIILPDLKNDRSPEEYYVKAGQTFTSDSQMIGEPYGNEAIKLIASKTSQDLSGIISNQGRSKRGIVNLDPFEKMLAQTFDSTTTRGIPVKRTSEEEVGTKTIYFKIIK